MRVLFTTLPAVSHLYHQVPLAWAFRAAGHEVRVVSQPWFAPAIIGTGLSPVEAGGGYDFMGAVTDLPEGMRLNAADLAAMSPETQREMAHKRSLPLVELAQHMARDLVPFAERWRPDLVVTDPVVFAGPLLAGVLGIPIVRNIWGPDILSGHPAQGQPNTGNERAEWLPGLPELFDEYGAEVRNDYPAHTVDPWPTSLQTFGAPRRLPRRYVPYNGAAVAPDWALRRPDRPRVCVTWGTTTSQFGGRKDLLSRVVTALTPLDLELVVAVSSADRARLGPLPDNVRVIENLPLNLLMPTCDAIVNQGGTGSVLTAASFGVPQVLVPETAETPANSISFNASGASVLLDAATLDAVAVTDAVTRVLDDDAIRAAADKVREEISGMPSPAAVVGTLEGLVKA